LTTIIPVHELQCPICKGDLVGIETEYSCRACGRKYPIRGGIHCFSIDSSSYRLWDSETRPAWKILAERYGAIRDFEEEILERYEFRGRVLELAAGICWMSSLLKAKFPECEVYGSDLCERPLFISQELRDFLGAAPDHLVSCDGLRTPFRDNYFDWIISRSYLNYTEAYGAIVEIRRIMRKSGKYVGIGELVSSTWLRHLYYWLYAPRAAEHKSARLARIMTRRQLEQAIRRAGFSLSRIEVDKDYSRKPPSSAPYYCLIGRIPDRVICAFLCTEVHLTLEK
jgi:ubiquinone/menaquinone biosynthesis C-methylase UbiE